MSLFYRNANDYVQRNVMDYCPVDEGCICLPICFSILDGLYMCTVSIFLWTSCNIFCPIKLWVKYNLWHEFIYIFMSFTSLSFKKISFNTLNQVRIRQLLRGVNVKAPPWNAYQSFLRSPSKCHVTHLGPTDKERMPHRSIKHE